MSSERILGGPLGVVLAPLGALYAGVAAIRVSAYQRHLFKSVRPPLPTLSIGNISAGGTGKTPLLFSILAWMKEHQLSAGVLSRGYGGDEGRLLEARFPEVSLIENPDRVSGLSEMLSASKPDILLLDDGFQHLRLQRDLDVVLIDATRPFGRCFPAGLFRESATALRRADLVVVSRASLVSEQTLDEIWHELKRVRGGLADLPRIEGDVQLLEVRCINTDEQLPLASLVGAEAMLACGIGNPQSFNHLCERAGVKVVATRYLRDHSSWNEQHIAAGAGHPLVLVTEKDAVKLQGRALDNMFVVRVDWEFQQGKEAWWQALDEFVLPVRAARIEPLWQAHLENMD